MSSSCAASVRSRAQCSLLPRRLRVLAVPLERTPSRPRGRSSRRWYRPAREPLPQEPGRMVVFALLARARRARGCATPGDDRLETRAYAVKRYLFRLGHAAGSARYATSIAQLVVGLAPVIGWGPVPRGGAARARFVRAHRRSVQRWLDDLQAAGLVVHEPERDEHGSWWRTQIVLRRAPTLEGSELADARRRAKGWGARERARRRAARQAPSLGAIRVRSAVPGPAVRARLARARGFAAHDARRRALVEAQIAEAQRRREACRDLAHPFGAPPPSALPRSSEQPVRRPGAVEAAGSAACRAARTVQGHGSVVVETGARGRAAPAIAAATPASS